MYSSCSSSISFWNTLLRGDPGWRVSAKRLKKPNWRDDMIAFRGNSPVSIKTNKFGVLCRTPSVDFISLKYWVSRSLGFLWPKASQLWRALKTTHAFKTSSFTERGARLFERLFKTTLFEDKVTRKCGQKDPPFTIML